MEFAEAARLAAIGLAVLGAIALALGTQLQNDTVTKHHSPQIVRFTSLRPGQLFDLLKRPRWLIGTSLLALAILFQLSALSLAPLMVVQPVGAVALVITALLNASIYKLKLTPQTWLAIAVTLSGVIGFVSVATRYATESSMSDTKLLQVVGLLAIALIVFAVLFIVSRGRARPMNYIFGAGVLFGFVAALAKVVITRLLQLNFDALTLLAVAALALAAVLGGWFVQNAYASGPPDLVIAGLTVVDPIVAVSVAIFVLRESAQATPFALAALGAAGAVAMAGVLMLSRFHPSLRDSRNR
jgi:drug/metabolite transporter (DMT)-like permease